MSMKILHHDIKLKAMSDQKDFWQKVWLTQRYVKSLGFREHDK